jgi:hypothetical protein
MVPAQLGRLNHKIMSTINNPGVASNNNANTVSVNGVIKVTTFTGDILQDGLTPAGDIAVNTVNMTNNVPCMVETPQNLADGSQRLTGVVYQNTTGHPILVCQYTYPAAGNLTMTAKSDSNPAPTTIVASGTTENGSTCSVTLVFFVLPGNYYTVTVSSGASTTVACWREFILQRGTFTDSGDIVGSRALSTVYQNTGTSPIFVSANITGVSANSACQGLSDSTPSPTNVIHPNTQSSSGTGAVQIFFIVPPSHYYKVTAGSGSLAHWHEYTWAVGCTKSQDLALTTGAGHTRSTNITTQAGNTGAGSGTATMLPVWQNTDTVRVRWVQVTSTNTTAQSQSNFYSGEGNPPLKPGGYIEYSTSNPRCLFGPIMPLMNYYVIDTTTSGTSTTNHWWEYQLG